MKAFERITTQDWMGCSGVALLANREQTIITILHFRTNDWWYDALIIIIGSKLLLLISKLGLFQRRDSLGMIQRQSSRVSSKRHFVYLAGIVVYSPLCHKEDGGREYALEEFTPCAAIQSLESFLLENGQKPMKSRSVTLSALMSRLQSTLDNASEKGRNVYASGSPEKETSWTLLHVRISRPSSN